mmetsp:Transcript_25045/g.54910  ORF Transcript_25045/g.54910 Transcript_25045/m.54910 type:complete len:90 (+) Transcript_25045:1098-1367(+)
MLCPTKAEDFPETLQRHCLVPSPGQKKSRFLPSLSIACVSSRVESRRVVSCRVAVRVRASSIYHGGRNVLSATISYSSRKWLLGFDVHD